MKRVKRARGTRGWWGGPRPAPPARGEVGIRPPRRASPTELNETVPRSKLSEIGDHAASQRFKIEPEGLPTPGGVDRPARSGGERGIRTLERVSPLHTFQACAFSHSAISPYPVFFGWVDVDPAAERPDKNPRSRPPLSMQLFTTLLRREATGGQLGIRTPDTLAGTPDFESGAFSHSASCPHAKDLPRPMMTSTSVGVGELSAQQGCCPRIRGGSHGLLPGRTRPTGKAQLTKERGQ